jgi:hypothetical protein
VNKHYHKQININEKEHRINESKNKICETYSKDEYDRTPIDSVLYMYGLKRVSRQEFTNIFMELNKYKCTEMIVHVNSIQHIQLHD